MKHGQKLAEQATAAGVKRFSHSITSFHTQLRRNSLPATFGAAPRASFSSWSKLPDHSESEATIPPLHIHTAEKLSPEDKALNDPMVRLLVQHYHVPIDELRNIYKRDPKELAALSTNEALNTLDMPGMSFQKLRALYKTSQEKFDAPVRAEPDTTYKAPSRRKSTPNVRHYHSHSRSHRLSIIAAEEAISSPEIQDFMKTYRVTAATLKQWYLEDTRKFYTLTNASLAMQNRGISLKQAITWYGESCEKFTEMTRNLTGGSLIISKLVTAGDLANLYDACQRKQPHHTNTLFNHALNDFHDFHTENRRTEYSMTRFINEHFPPKTAQESLLAGRIQEVANVTER